MITIYNYIISCCRSHKIRPEIIEITELDLFYNKVRLNRESSIIIHNSFKEKSEKLKSNKLDYFF